MSEKTEELRRRILAAALQVMGELGYEGASTRLIAARAGVAHSLMRYYFPTKEELWLALVRDYMEAFVAAMRTTVEACDPSDPAGTLRAVIELMVRQSVASPGFHRITLLGTPYDDSRLKWLTDEYIRGFYDFMMDLIKAGQAQGKVRPLDPVRLAHGLATLIGGFFLAANQMQVLSGRDMLAPEETEESIAFFHAFVFKDDPGA